MKVLPLLLLGWAYSIALVVGPYVALLTYVESPPAWAHIVYWLVMFIFIGGTATHDPVQYDLDELGWLGGLMDNPFTFEDDAARHGLMITLLLLPARPVVWTLGMTWQLITGGFGGEE